MKRYVVAALAVFAAAPVLAQQAPAPPAQVRNPANPQQISDPEFLKYAGISNLFEIQSSQLALQKAKDDRVKQFARQMVQDHTKANDTLRSLTPGSTSPQSSAQSAGSPHAERRESGLGVPTALDPAHTHLLDELHRAGGADFDRLYALQQLQAHEDAVKFFQAYAQQPNSDAKLRQFAQNMIPQLQQHLEMARRLPHGG